MRVAILQSNYIPWRGYFDIIKNVDTFVFHDDLQYTKNDWRNRNRIKSASGLRWLTIPVGDSEKRLINEVVLPGNDWKTKHLKLIEQSYSNSLFWNDFQDLLNLLYVDSNYVNLSDFNQSIIKIIAKDYLNLNVEFRNSTDLDLTGKKQERVMQILRKTGATSYLSGPSGKNYLDENDFREHSIKLHYIDYSNLKEYPQMYGHFENAVSIIDLIFNCGYDSRNYLTSTLVE